MPVLVWNAGRPSADLYLPELLLAEILRLGERAQATMQERWVPEGGSVRNSTTWWTSTELEDLLFLQGELTGAMLDLYDREGMRRLERRAATLRDRLRLT